MALIARVVSGRPMPIARTVAECRAAIAARNGRRIGLVATMGALHDGHVALMRRARNDCDVVVVSLFVNPTQFDDLRDLATYPRDEPRDIGLASEAGADLLFAPTVSEMYPSGFGTTVEVMGPSERLEGQHRGRPHFRGVATVVTRLLNVVKPHVAYFGQKDAQQVAVIRRLVLDLHLEGGIEIVVVPTVREPDGLALSSRNALLSTKDRARAASLYAALREIETALKKGEASVPSLLERAQGRLDVDRLDYLEVVNGETFAPLQTVERRALAVVAAWLGDVRLIDNIEVGAS
jgi:pantoate--beta-alanine ligase